MQLFVKPYVKIIVLQADMFETKIIDEKNFDPKDDFKIVIFKNKYRDPKFTIVTVVM